ncbi:hypothetical protein MTO96_022820 [Rhipicephalus appendiculatus]
MHVNSAGFFSKGYCTIIRIPSVNHLGSCVYEVLKDENDADDVVAVYAGVIANLTNATNATNAQMLASDFIHAADKQKFKTVSVDYCNNGKLNVSFPTALVRQCNTDLDRSCRDSTISLVSPLISLVECFVENALPSAPQDQITALLCDLVESTAIDSLVDDQLRRSVDNIKKTLYSCTAFQIPEVYDMYRCLYGVECDESQASSPAFDILAANHYPSSTCCVYQAYKKYNEPANALAAYADVVIQLVRASKTGDADALATDLAVTAAMVEPEIVKLGYCFHGNMNVSLPSGVLGECNTDLGLSCQRSRCVYESLKDFNKPADAFVAYADVLSELVKATDVGDSDELATDFMNSTNQVETGTTKLDTCSYGDIDIALPVDVVGECDDDFGLSCLDAFSEMHLPVLRKKRITALMCDLLSSTDIDAFEGHLLWQGAFDLTTLFCD